MAKPKNRTLTLSHKDTDELYVDETNAPIYEKKINKGFDSLSKVFDAVAKEYKKIANAGAKDSLSEKFTNVYKGAKKCSTYCDKSKAELSKKLQLAIQKYANNVLSKRVDELEALVNQLSAKIG